MSRKFSQPLSFSRRLLTTSDAMNTFIYPAPPPSTSLVMAHPPVEYSNSQAVVRAPVARQKPNEVLDLSMPDTFYTTEIPEDSPAFFSTNMGKDAKRALLNPRPAPLTRSRFHEDVANTAKQLRDRFPKIVRDITQIKAWPDLYKFWDGYDLWVQGAAFCYWVIEQIVKKNDILRRMITKEINLYAAEWIEFHRDQVLASPLTTNLTTLFLPGDEEAGLATLSMGENHILRCALERERNRLLEATRPPPQSLHPIQEAQQLKTFPPFLSQTPIGPPPPPYIPVFPVGQVGPVQSYSSFMQNQRYIASNHSTPNSMRHEDWAMQGHNRRRNMSNDSSNTNNHSMKNGRFGYGNAGYNGKRALSSTSGGSPHKKHNDEREPIYVRTGQSSRPESTPNRNISAPANPRFPHNFNDARLDPANRRRHEPVYDPISALFKNDPKARIDWRNHCTYSYSDNYSSYAENNNRTVYVENVPKEFFVSHGLAGLMSEAGEVNRIYYANDGRHPHAAAFVTFEHVGTVDFAIEKFGQIRIPTGDTIRVQKPRDKVYRHPRDRSNSQISNKSFGPDYNSRYGGDQFRRHPQRNNSNSSNQFYRQDGPSSRPFNEADTPTPKQAKVGGQQTPSGSESGSHQSKSTDDPPQTPLNSVESTPKDTKLRNEDNVSASSEHKENSPPKVAQDESSKVEFDNQGSNSPKPQKKKGDRNSRSNTDVTTRSADLDNSNSSQSTVSSHTSNLVSPMNPGEKSDEVGTDAVQATANEQENEEPRRHIHKKSTQKYSKQYASTKATPISTNHTLTQSDLSESPTDTIASTATDLCAASCANLGDNRASGKQPGITSAKSEASLPGMTKSAERQPSKEFGQKRNTKKLHKTNRRYSVKGEQKEQKKDSKVESEENQKEDKSRDNTTSVFSQPKGAANVNENDQQTQNHAKKNTQGVDGQSTVNENEPPKEPSRVPKKESVGTFQPQPDSQKSSNANTFNENRQGGLKKGGFTQQYRHEKKGSNASSACGSTLSIRSKPSVGFTNVSGSSTPKKTDSSNLFEDPNLWPALGPSSSPQSSIADGKRPPPFRPVVPRKAPIGTVVPAVPHNIKKPRPQSEDILGGQEYPFVKRSRPVWAKWDYWNEVPVVGKGPW
ncbi:hypothetical protein HYALB_00009566 [Hymenoscyphus albidus]|uniref:RRM domain-containing protein n=1 Tax=Hymenoscyphus albidus TaxID=595503 RepID=A0A9N9LKK7_9HELO|nr:hypothetical protein HYALB_00009566 [Hymenoscyphus albidus]